MSAFASKSCGVEGGALFYACKTKLLLLLRRPKRLSFRHDASYVMFTWHRHHVSICLLVLAGFMCRPGACKWSNSSAHCSGAALAWMLQPPSALFPSKWNEVLQRPLIGITGPAQQKSIYSSRKLLWFHVVRNLWRKWSTTCCRLVVLVFLLGYTTPLNVSHLECKIAAH